MMKRLKLNGQKIKDAYWSLVSMTTVMMVSIQPVMADTIWTRFSNIMKDIYSQLVGISTIVSVMAASIAQIVHMISCNQRAVDEEPAG